MLIGSFVIFDWWSSYKAASVNLNDDGQNSWHDVDPGDSGIIIEMLDDEHVSVLFSGTDKLLKIHTSMLLIVD
jgi:hypothetical protein